MILVDTSAWVEYLRRTGSAVNVRLRTLIDEDRPIAYTEPVALEVLVGARNDTDREFLRRLLYRFELLPLRGLADHEAAVDLYRACRRSGVTVRSVVDCLIAAVAVREDVPVLHADADFAALARHTALRVVDPEGGDGSA